MSRLPLSSREKAKTQPLATRVVAMLMNTRKNPQCMSWEGTIWHGPSFKNLAMPNAPEKTEILKVVMNMAVLVIPRKLFWGPINRDLFLRRRANRIKTVGTAST